MANDDDDDAGAEEDDDAKVAGVETGLERHAGKSERARRRRSARLRTRT